MIGLDRSDRSVTIIGTRGYPSYYGGFETAVRRLAPYLANQGWDVAVYGRSGATWPDDPARDFRVRSITTRGLSGPTASTLSHGLTACWDAARRRPSVALVMNVANGFYLPMLRAAGVRTLLNVDGIEWERDKWGAIAKRTFRVGTRVSALSADSFVFDSLEIAKRWSNEFGVQGHYIPYGGEIPPELPLEPGLSHRGYVLFVARFVPENSVAAFLAAVPVMAERYPVVIVGSSGGTGSFDQCAQNLASEYRSVRWLGHISDDARLHSLWQHAGAYFHGHSVGGTNPALVQAMACGAPIVARDTVYNREVLANAGILIPASPSTIAEAILRVMDDPASQFDASQRAVERARFAYSWPRVCEGYESAMLSLIGLAPRQAT